MENCRESRGRDPKQQLAGGGGLEALRRGPRALGLDMLGLFLLVEARHADGHRDAARARDGAWLSRRQDEGLRAGRQEAQK